MTRTVVNVDYGDEEAAQVKREKLLNGLQSKLGGKRQSVKNERESCRKVQQRMEKLKQRSLKRKQVEKDTAHIDETMRYDYVCDQQRVRGDRKQRAREAAQERATKMTRVEMRGARKGNNDGLARQQR
jgi:hypothetical protein